MRTREQSIVEIKQNAVAGRALWVGLFVDCRDAEASGIGALLPPDAHVTLAYFGRGQGRMTDAITERVDEILRACDGLGDALIGEIDYEFTGLGIFKGFKAPIGIALVNSAGVCELAQPLRHELDADRRFGFIPHVTLREDSDLREQSLYVDRLVKRPAKFFCPMLVCGDARLALPR